MSLADGFLAEFDHEMAGTRKVLERVPDDKLDWTPHAKSMNLVGLATHIANLPQWADARAAIQSAADDHLLAPWTLLAAGKTVFTMPRIAVLRSFVVSHVIHHRAQLGVYLRLNDIPVPAVYGPTADEAG